MDRIVKIYRADFRHGADKLHERLDGRVRVPEKLAVALVGSLSAIVPLAIALLLFASKGGTIC